MTWKKRGRDRKGQRGREREAKRETRNTVIFPIENGIFKI